MANEEQITSILTPEFDKNMQTIQAFLKLADEARLPLDQQKALCDIIGGITVRALISEIK